MLTFQLPQVRIPGQTTITRTTRVFDTCSILSDSVHFELPSANQNNRIPKPCDLRLRLDSMLLTLILTELGHGFDSGLLTLYVRSIQFQRTNPNPNRPMN